MEMNLKAPTSAERRDYQGEAELAYVMKAGGQPMDINKDQYAELTVLIDKSGWLCFEYFSQSPSNHYDEPPEDIIREYHMDCANVEAAKGIAEVVLLDIEHTTEERWVELGFLREDI